MHFFCIFVLYFLLQNFFIETNGQTQGLCIQGCYNADVNCLLKCNVDPVCQAACADRYNECVAACPTREPDRCCKQCPDDPTCVEERCCKYHCHCW